MVALRFTASVNSHNLIAYAMGKVFGGSRCTISAKSAVQIGIAAKNRYQWLSRNSNRRIILALKSKTQSKASDSAVAGTSMGGKVAD